MGSPVRLVDRIVAPLLMASGVTLLGAGLLSFGGGTFTGLANPPAVAVRPTSTAEPTLVVLPGPSVAATPTATPTPTSAGSPSPTSGGSPSVPPSPEPSATEPPLAFATRVVMPSQGIDLPIISRLRRVPGQGPGRYPPCDVALFHDAFVQPSQEGTVYVYAHAQPGMFLPLLEESRRNSGQRMLGRLIELYSDDDHRFVYEITKVKRHALDFSLADAEPGAQQVILQTSEGPSGTFEKLQVLGVLIGESEAEPGEAHPRPRPRPCFPG